MTAANGSGTWTRWVLGFVVVGLIAVTGVVGANRSTNAAQDVQIDNIVRGFERIEAKLDRILEKP